MGPSDSKAQNGKTINVFNFDSVSQMIGQFDNTEIDQQIFTNILFSKLD